jgi:FkbM family methyltransferase
MNQVSKFMKKTLVSAVAKNWPFANGSGRLIDKLASEIDLGEHETQCKTSDGFNMHCLPNDLIGRHLILSGSFDRAGADALSLFLETGDQIMDLGANIGYVSCLLLQKSKDTSVICYEPQPTVVSLLRKNLSQFGTGRWQVVEAGMSDANGKAMFSVDESNRGSSRLAGEATQVGILHEIELRDSREEFAKLKQLDVVKIDIEGHEWTVLNAAAEQLQRLRPKAILYEDNRRISGPDQQLGRLMDELGYDIYGLHKRLTRTDLTAVTHDNAAHFHDFIAVSRHRTIPERARNRFGLQ